MSQLETFVNICIIYKIQLYDTTQLYKEQA